ncbi:MULTISPECIES: YndJ family protein [Cellulomonas]|uniref:YndJ family protein n=1 Tax=Cellulomonas TaxID=1707 RepID=UPI001CA41580|nr:MULTISPECIES: YndJ family protein [Cellulomonas]
MSAPLTPAAVAGVQAAVALGAVVVLPLGLRLLADARLVPVPVPRSPLWPVAGASAAVALLLPRGAVAVVVALPFAVAGAVLLAASARALVALLRSRAAGGSLPAALCAAVAPGTVAVGALALVADRAGWSVLGFEGDILLLTVPHMLFAGFGACLVAGLCAAAEGAAPSRLARVGALGVAGGVLAVLGGYLVSDEAELVGTVVLTAGLWCATAAAWRAARRTSAPAAARWSALAAAGAVVAMLLALWWAVGEVTDLPHPDLSWMVATHGALNALTVVLASVVALRLRAGGGGTRVAPGQEAGAGSARRRTRDGEAGTWTTTR